MGEMCILYKMLRSLGATWSGSQPVAQCSNSVVPWRWWHVILKIKLGSCTHASALWTSPPHLILTLSFSTLPSNLPFQGTSLSACPSSNLSRLSWQRTPTVSARRWSLWTWCCSSVSSSATMSSRTMPTCVPSFPGGTCPSPPPRGPGHQPGTTWMSITQRTTRWKWRYALRGQGGGADCLDLLVLIAMCLLFSSSLK